MFFRLLRVGGHSPSASLLAGGQYTDHHDPYDVTSFRTVTRMPRSASHGVMNIKTCLALSLPMLLTFACFNDAFGLTTFGISPNQNPKNQRNQPPGNTKPCTDQSNCTYIKDTTCLKGFCYCGDNTHPVNGRCKTTEKGQSHICQKEEECVEGALCIVRPKEFQTSSTAYLNNYTVCWCEDGVAFPNGKCAGELPFL
ncbi:unnamed protein product [Acanthoscelides obtectus]|uniref:EB domain-containing protein n=1 Tax=Acanthoscelides obtectus TaxID=200917 RepID=A0A9P0LC06_ACAOB|nr:unnamed protein product [Acanthoscelides obtectus]CAK1675956.1 hypothetical protein AOBTE_LOCUS30509 [Acanthoscelides obtectus]